MSINIPFHPTVNIYRGYQRYDYPIQFALAEFIDNSIQSAIDHKLSEVKITITWDVNTQVLTIYDCAGGIETKRLQKGALQPGVEPDNKSGMHEFGQGLKAAAFSLADKWTLKTSARNEPIERTIYFDIDEVLKNEGTSLPNEESELKEEPSYTQIDLVLRNPRQFPKTKALSKLKNSLGLTYSHYLKEGSAPLIDLTIITKGLKGSKNSHPVEYQAYIKPSDILFSPPFKSDGTPDLNKEEIKWKKNILIHIKGDTPQKDKTIKGYVCIKKVGSSKNKGFAIFRRNRFVCYYKPEDIFGASSTTRLSQRLSGELFLENFDAGPRKDTIPNFHENPNIAEVIKKQITEEPLNLIRQVTNHNKDNMPEKKETSPKGPDNRNNTSKNRTSKENQEKDSKQESNVEENNRLSISDNKESVNLFSSENTQDTDRPLETKQSSLEEIKTNMGPYNLELKSHPKETLLFVDNNNIVINATHPDGQKLFSLLKKNETDFQAFLSQFQVE